MSFKKNIVFDNGHNNYLEELYFHPCGTDNFSKYSKMGDILTFSSLVRCIIENFSLAYLDVPLVVILAPLRLGTWLFFSLIDEKEHLSLQE